MDYVALLVNRPGRLFFEAYKDHPHLAIHPYQDLQTILSAFVRVASNSVMYSAVIRGDHVSLANYRTAIDVADRLTSDLRSIIHGNGLGKFEGVPSTSPWWGATPSTPKFPTLRVGFDTGRSSGVSVDTATKRQKTQDPGEDERRKTMGLLVYDTAVSGSNRLPAINVYAKKRGAKMQERLCMKFLTRGYSCPNADCKFPHLTGVDSLPANEKAKFVSFVKKAVGLSWAEGKAPPGTTP
jgi:hypothetical protein